MFIFILKQKIGQAQWEGGGGRGRGRPVLLEADCACSLFDFVHAIENHNYSRYRVNIPVSIRKLTSFVFIDIEIKVLISGHLWRLNTVRFICFYTEFENVTFGKNEKTKQNNNISPSFLIACHFLSFFSSNIEICVFLIFFCRSVKKRSGCADCQNKTI